MCRCVLLFWWHFWHAHVNYYQVVANLSRSFPGFESAQQFSTNIFEDTDDYSSEVVALLSRSTQELRDNVLSCLRSVAECLASRKGVYLAQLKKSRDVSNMATRAAVQVSDSPQ